MALAYCVVALHVSVAQQSEQGLLRLGFVNLTTAKAAENLSNPGSFLGGVVVRFVPSSGTHESFAITDKYGVALVPLLPGSYCADAYGTDGKKLRLEARLNGAKPVCFVLKSQEMKDIGVTVDHSEDYKPSLQAHGVD